MDNSLDITILDAIKLIASQSGKQISYSVSHYEEPTGGVFGTGMRSKTSISHTTITIDLKSLSL